MSQDEAEVLLAEDDDADVYLFQRAFQDAGVTAAVHVTHDGQECIDYLEERLRLAMRGEWVRVPRLLVLDLKMPRMSGMDVLRWRRDQPVLRTLPAIIFSSSSNQQDVELAYLLGACAFLTKPPTTDARMALAKLIDGFWLKANRPPLMSTEGLAPAIKLHGTIGLWRTGL
jgi:CheY-like chemotaxis protein